MQDLDFSERSVNVFKLFQTAYLTVVAIQQVRLISQRLKTRGNKGVAAKLKRRKKKKEKEKTNDFKATAQIREILERFFSLITFYPSIISREGNRA